MRRELTIIIPINVAHLGPIEGLSGCYVDLLGRLSHDFPMEVILVDSSSPEIFQCIELQLAGTVIQHLRTPDSFKCGKNDKLNNISYGLSVSTGKSIAIFDDDLRPTSENIRTLIACLHEFDFLKCMVNFPNASIFDLVDLSGIYIVNLLSKHRQFWANFCFRRELILGTGFPCKDVLFDELAFEMKFRTVTNNHCYLIAPSIPMHSFRCFPKFLEQRVRYAYENLAYPMRSLIFLSLVPLAAAILCLRGVLALCLFISVITVIVLALSRLGEFRYGSIYQQRSVWIYAPIWFWFYPFTTWIAVYLWCIGGIRFGNSLIRRAV